MYIQKSNLIDFEKCFELLGYKNKTYNECIKKFVDFNEIKTYNYEEEVEYEFERYLPDDGANELIGKIIDEQGIRDVYSLEKGDRNRLIRKIKKVKCINNSQIADFFDMKRDTVSKI